MAKDKKAKGAKSAGKADGGKKKAKAGKTVSSLKSVAANPLVQEVVAAALVATAAALKDSKKARAMAAHAGDQLEAMAEDGAEKGKALWILALEVAQRAGDIISEGKRKKKDK